MIWLGARTLVFSGSHRMRGAAKSLWRGFTIIVATLIAIVFFLVITGVVGVPASIAALALFVILAILIFHRPQIGETRQ
jgi:hypothetical protein